MNPLFRQALSNFLLASSLFVSGCGVGSASGSTSADVSGANQNQSTSGKSTSYPEMKTIVLDILHSQEGMKTLKDTVSSPDFKSAAAINQTDIQKAVEKMVKTEDNKKTFLSQAMKDPQFAASMVEAARPQITQVQKQLIKDPDYQKALLALMKTADYQKMQFDLLKDPEYRKEIMKIMTEALEQPTFRVLFMDSLKEAVKSASGGQKDKVGQSSGQGQQGKSKQQSGSESGSSGSDSGSDSSSGDSGG